VWTQDSLFRYVVRGVLRTDPTRGEKQALLGRLRDKGVYLIDASPEPLFEDLGSPVPRLVSRVKRAEPRHVILIKHRVYDAAYADLAAAGLPVVDVRIPFPGSGQQRRFEAAFARALRKVDWGR
jgi:hypothetical protein